MPATPGSLLPAARALDATSGEAVDLPALAREGPALVFVYKDDCPASTLGAVVLPRLAAVPGLVVAAVAQDPPDAARRFAAAQGWAGTAVRVLVDPEPWAASDALGVLTTPTWILVARGGTVDRLHGGWSRDDAVALAARAAALAGAKVPAVVRPGDAGPAFRPG